MGRDKAESALSLPTADEILANAKPFAEQGLLSYAAGYCTGIALKTWGRAAATVAGSAFLVLQGATYAGYIDGVNWSRFEKDFVRILDKDNDGKVTANDVQILWEKFNSVVTFGFPSAGGFSAGLAYAASGSFVKAAVGAGVGASGLALGTAHLYQNTDWLPPILQRSAPGISKRLDHAAEHAAEQGSFVRRGLERGWGAMMSSRPRASLDDLRSQEAELRREQKAILLVDHPSSRNKRDLTQIEYKLGKIREEKEAIKSLQREEKRRAAAAAGRGAAAAAAEAAGSHRPWWGWRGKDV